MNPIYLYPTEEVQYSPESEMSPYFDYFGVLSPIDSEYFNYSDCEEFYKAPVPENLVLADFVL